MGSLVGLLVVAPVLSEPVCGFVLVLGDSGTDDVLLVGVVVLGLLVLLLGLVLELHWPPILVIGVLVILILIVLVVGIGLTVSLIVGVVLALVIVHTAIILVVITSVVVILPT